MNTPQKKRRQLNTVEKLGDPDVGQWLMLAVLIIGLLFAMYLIALFAKCTFVIVTTPELLQQANNNSPMPASLGERLLSACCPFVGMIMVSVWFVQLVRTIGSRFIFTKYKNDDDQQ